MGGQGGKKGKEKGKIFSKNGSLTGSSTNHIPQWYSRCGVLLETVLKKWNGVSPLGDSQLSIGIRDSKTAKREK